MAAGLTDERRSTMNTVASGQTPPGSRSMMLTVAKVIDETADARSFVFDVPDEREDRFGYRPGQFLTVRIPSTRTGSVARCYSLSSSPDVDAELKITVKRTADGYGSNWLCDNVGAGDTLEVLPPAGVFTPADLNRELTLWAGGSGITPVMSILKSVLTAGTGRLTLVYANRDEQSVIFADELRALTSQHPQRLTVIHWLESLLGLPSRRQLAGLAAAYTRDESFLCGPAPFMDAVRQALAGTGVARSSIHTEVFVSLTGDPFSEALGDEPTSQEPGAARAEVDLDGHRHVLRWPRTANLVEAMLARGLDVPYSCREGHCGSCACTLVSGKVDTGNTEILDQQDIADGIMLACQARPVSDEIRIEF